jgi:hypothetical protein
MQARKQSKEEFRSAIKELGLSSIRKKLKKPDLLDADAQQPGRLPDKIMTKEISEFIFVEEYGELKDNLSVNESDALDDLISEFGKFRDLSAVSNPIAPKKRPYVARTETVTCGQCGSTLLRKNIARHRETCLGSRCDICPICHMVIGRNQVRQHILYNH